MSQNNTTGTPFQPLWRSGDPAGVVADFCRSSLPRRTSRLAATCLHVNQSSRPIFWHLLHTRFALRRKSFPAERTYLNNQSRLHPTSPEAAGNRPSSRLPQPDDVFAATGIFCYPPRAANLSRTADDGGTLHSGSSGRNWKCFVRPRNAGRTFLSDKPATGKNAYPAQN